jgi:trimeric autotransporter adhesin
MAQDFHAAFGLGDSNRHIGMVDADGVALAAIQGLHSEADERLRALEEENRKLRERLESLENAILAMRQE